MATNVVMPQMGESIAEGTIVRWIKKVGDAGRPRRAAVRDLDRQGRRGDPVAGRGRADRDQGQGRGDRPGQPRGGRDRRSGIEAGRVRRRPRRPSCRSRRRSRKRRPASRSARRAANGDGGAALDDAQTKDDLRRQKSSPLVRRIAHEHNVDIAADPRDRDQRPRDQAGHPRLHRVGAAAAAERRRRGVRRRRRAAPRSGLPARRARRDRADDA